MRTLLIGLTIVLTLLVAACGPFASSEPATVPTSAPAIAPATAPAATAAAAPTTAPQTAPTARPQISPTAAPTNTVAGDTVRIVLVQGINEARYRVREQLAGINFPSDAVGATKAVTGVIVAKTDGTILRDQSKITVDLSTLRSDDNRRDNFLRTSTLQTSRYPTATFVPTEARGLSLPLKDGALEFKLVGDLTIHAVTKPVTWDVKGTLKGNEATGQATTSFNFAYFNLPQPRVPLVLSVEDNIKLEIDLHLRRE